MGKALRPEHIRFFTARMDGHSRVIRWTLIDNEHEYLFKIKRELAGTHSDVIVHLTDAYGYGLSDFYARPDEIKGGSFVVIGMPHANASDDVIEKGKEHHIGIGHIGKFMGALNCDNVWEYMTAEEQEQKKGR